MRSVRLQWIISLEDPKLLDLSL
jgi:hypothetical protein